MLFEHQFPRKGKVCAAQLPIETMLVSFGKRDPMFDIHTAIIFNGNSGAKINKFPDDIESTLIDCHL